MTDPALAPRHGSRVLGTRRTTAVVTVVVALLIVALAYFSGPSTGGTSDVELPGGVVGSRPRVGELAPDFQATLIDGSSISLSDYRGQPLWLLFGASWCGDCRAEAPDVEETYQRFAPEGLALLQISIAEDSRAAADYAERAGLTFPTAADPDEAIASRYHILGVPTHIFISPDGIIREIRIGGLQPEDMVQSVEALLG